MQGNPFIQMEALMDVHEHLFGFRLRICQVIPSRMDVCPDSVDMSCSIFRRQDPRKVRGSFGLSLLGQASLSRGFARELQGLTGPQNRQNIWVHSITADLVIIPS